MNLVRRSSSLILPGIMTSAVLLSAQSPNTLPTTKITEHIAPEVAALGVDLAPGMSREEAIVRRCYAKLSWLTQLTVYANAALEVEGIWRAADPVATRDLAERSLITYQIANVKSGPLSEIANKPWGEVVDIPESGILVPQVQVNHQSWGDRNEQFGWETAEVAWAPSRQPDLAAEGRRAIRARSVAVMISLAHALPAYADLVYDRYATYTVLASYQGKTLGPYKAMFLFGQKAIGESDTAVDLFMDTGALSKANTESFYPDLLHSHLRDITILRDWLYQEQMQGCSIAGAVCCLADRCGVRQQDLARAFSIPLVSEPRHGEANPEEVQP